jgi:type IV pilus assembly protein PilV
MPAALKRHRPAAARCQRGTTMIEALVTLLVLGLSAMAFAALQIKGVTGNNGALYRSKAVQLAAEMADRIRANGAGRQLGQYNTLTGAATFPACGATTACAAPTASNADMAKYDYAAWRQALADNLPTGSGVVCSDSTPNDGTATAPACDNAVTGAGAYLTIKVFWSEHGETQRVWSLVR